MKVWITKYALAKGVLEKEAEDCGDGIAKESESYLPTYYHGTDWHKDKQSAIFKAEEMRKKKIVSLEKQIKKLEKMRFE